MPNGAVDVDPAGPITDVTPAGRLLGHRIADRRHPPVLAEVIAVCRLPRADCVLT